jgi:hypothetical protein
MSDKNATEISATASRTTTSPLAYFNSIVGIIGCLTGLLALGWHIWDSSNARKDTIVAEIDEDFEIDAPWDEITLRVDITNIGQRPIYVKSAFLSWEHGNRITSGPLLFSSERPELPIQSGGYRRYKMAPRSERELDDLMKMSNNNTLIATIVTSRGTLSVPIKVELLKVTLWFRRVAREHNERERAPK